MGVWNRTGSHRIGTVLTFPGCATLTPKLKWIRFGFGSRSQQEEISSCSFRNCFVLLQNYFFNETLFLNFKNSFPLRLFVFFAQILCLKITQIGAAFLKKTGSILVDNSNKTDPKINIRTKPRDETGGVSVIVDDKNCWWRFIDVDDKNGYFCTTGITRTVWDWYNLRRIRGVSANLPAELNEVLYVTQIRITGF